MAIKSFAEASQLAQKADHEEESCRVSMDLALKKLKKVLEEVDQADRRLHDAEIWRGQISHIIRQSGFKLPVSVPSPPRSLVHIEPDGGAYLHIFILYCYADILVQSPIMFA